MVMQEDGRQHLMDHMLGVCASKRRLILRAIIATPQTRNGLAIPANLTTEEDPFSFLGNLLTHIYNH